MPTGLLRNAQAAMRDVGKRGLVARNPALAALTVAVGRRAVAKVAGLPDKAVVQGAPPLALRHGAHCVTVCQIPRIMPVTSPGAITNPPTTIAITTNAASSVCLRLMSSTTATSPATPTNSE